jgi:hypothetical protein
MFLELDLEGAIELLESGEAVGIGAARRVLESRLGADALGVWRRRNVGHGHD